METGDEQACREMSEHILNVQQNIKPALRHITQPRAHLSPHPQRAGFKELLRVWEDIYRDVSSTMQSLSRRIEDSTSVLGKQEPKRSGPTKRNDDVTITLKELDFMLDHLKNSWEEVIDGGAIVYVNVFDRARRVRERPEGGFIKSVPRVPRAPRLPSWDQLSRTRVPSWERDDW
jgi:hypothetical protein